MTVAKWRAILRPVALVALSVAAILALLALALSVAGADTVHALRALWFGSIGSWDALTSATLVRATPLVLTGLAVTLAFRAGVWNIGAEGQLLAGAAAATGVALSSTSLGMARGLSFLSPSFGSQRGSDSDHSLIADLPALPNS